MRKLVLADCLDALRELADESVDAVVTDPPYGLGSKEPTPEDILAYLSGGALDTHGDFMGKKWEIPPVEVWKECFRVLKPGGHLLSFGGTRTFDLISMGIRMAGFEDRDTIASYFGGVFGWLQGQGFPKSLDISKAIDKQMGVKRTEVVGKGQAGAGFHYGNPGDGGFGNTAELEGGVPSTEWDVTAPASEEAQKWAGWGTALKPAWEPVLVFRKPLAGTVADNVLEHGVGGINIDGCRVGTGQRQFKDARSQGQVCYGEFPQEYEKGTGRSNTSEGRWPPNVVLCHLPGCKRVGTKKVRGSQLNQVIERSKSNSDTYAGGKQQTDGYCQGYTDKNGTETVDDWECEPGCPVKALGEQTQDLHGAWNKGAEVNHVTANEVYAGGWKPERHNPDYYGNEGGSAARFFPQFEGQELPDAPFFYTGKATKSETTLDGQVENKHPTKKPLELMKWLVKLVCPKDGVVLDPYAGSGTTCAAAVQQGSGYVGIERDPTYFETARARLDIIEQEYDADQGQRDIFDLAMGFSSEDDETG